VSSAARKERWDRLTNDEKEKIEEERQLIIEWDTWWFKSALTGVYLFS
jgi:hypothetical protein